MTNAALCLQPAAPHLRLMSNDDTDRTTPTDLAPPPSADDRPITQPPGKLETMLPAPPLSLEDSYLDRAIRVVAMAGDDMRKGREEARSHHEAVLDAIRRSDANQTRNYEMVRDEIRRLQQSDVSQDSKIATLTTRMGVMERLVEASHLSPEFQDKFRDMHAAVMSLIEDIGGGALLSGRKVLCVDDQPLILKSMIRVLAGHGAAVFTAESFDGVKAMVEAVRPDCATVDVKLLGEEDGIEVARWLIRSAGMAPSQVLLVTGNDLQRAKDIASTLGVRLLPKPMPNTEFVQAVREASATRQS